MNKKEKIALVILVVASLGISFFIGHKWGLTAQILFIPIAVVAAIITAWAID